MGALSKAHFLTAEQTTKLDACIRSHRYRQIDAVRASMAGDGIALSRSALHRYIVNLKASDTAHPPVHADTVITIMARSTGAIRMLSSDASPDAVAAMLASVATPK